MKLYKILPHAPKKYLEQGFAHCGAYSVKAILSAYGKDSKKNPVDYEPHLLARYIGISNGMLHWPKVLKRYGISACDKNTKNLSDRQRIKLLKKLLDRNKSVMLRIGNGYSKSGKYRPVIASFIGHWITLWGYNDKEKIFYIYDSWVSLEKHDKTIPAGNTKRTYREILRDWSKGFPFTWHYGYIEINPKERRLKKGFLAST